MDINIPKTNLKRVLIIGGGFAGLNLAMKLNRKVFQVILLDKNNFHLFQPLLYQVASSGLEPGSICFPFRKILQKKKAIIFRLADVFSVLPNENRIETSIGSISYDYLVIAAGTTTNFFHNSNLEKEAFPMKKIEETLQLKNNLINHIEQSLTCTDEQEKKAYLSIVIVGGGATGVEIAGVLAEMRRFIFKKDYPEIDTSQIQIYLIEGSNRLLNVMSEKSSACAKKFLEKMGVRILLEKKVLDAKDDYVILDDGQSIHSKTIIWVSGIMANPFKNIEAELLGRGGRILVNSFNQIQPFPALFAIGDIALQTEPDYPNGHPQVAPVAIQQGLHLAKNLELLISGKDLKAFRYKNRGSLATVGRNKAVADFGRIHLSGFPAWALWMLIHIRSILGVKNKLTVLIDWVWNYFTYDQSFRFILSLKEKNKDLNKID